MTDFNKTVTPSPLKHWSLAGHKNVVWRYLDWLGLVLHPAIDGLSVNISKLMELQYEKTSPVCEEMLQNLQDKVFG